MLVSNCVIRAASKDDAPDLAYLINLAGEGMPFWMWENMAEVGQTPWDVGVARASRETGSFSYRNAYVIAGNESANAMLLGYRQPSTFDLTGLREFPEPLQPLIELEAMAPDSWYVNGLATRPGFQGKGMGSALLAFAESLAREANSEYLSLIVASDNENAKRLYQAAGYRLVAKQDGWELMTKWL